jgi:hypothetical protein
MGKALASLFAALAMVVVVGWSATPANADGPSMAQFEVHVDGKFGPLDK